MAARKKQKQWRRRPLRRPIRLQNQRENASMSTMGRVTRRRFLQTTGLGIAAAPVLSPFVAKEAFAADKALSIVQWAHFVPEYDTWFDNFAKEWGKKNN